MSDAVEKPSPPVARTAAASRVSGLITAITFDSVRSGIRTDAPAGVDPVGIDAIQG
ncbi:hypothetical protein GCM10027167_79360 [Nocardia heshunensis]